MPAPNKVSLLRSFLGMCQYYRGYEKNYSTKCKPLYELTKDNIHYKWTQNEQEAFDKVKRDLSSNELLAHPDFNLPFKIQTDASELSFATGRTKMDSQRKGSASNSMGYTIM